MDNEKINEIKSLDEYFPKGNKHRGKALVLVAEAFLLGKESVQQTKSDDVYEKGMEALKRLRQRN